MKMTQFTPAALREVRERMERALNDVSKDLGINFEIGKIKFSSDVFNAQITCVVASQTSDDSSVAKTLWNKSCHMYSNVKSSSLVYKGEGKPCTCGSGLPRWSLDDARGIFCSYICDECEKEVKSRYRPEVLEDADYEAIEQIEEE